MRINRFVAQASGLSRRAVDRAISTNRIKVNNIPGVIGQDVAASDKVELDGKILALPTQNTMIMINKPVGYVVSRNGQGSQTIYDLLPLELHSLKPIGRLDKDSSGLLLLTNNGQLSYELMHPRFFKQKTYNITLNRTLRPDDRTDIERGIKLEDGLSKMTVNGKDRAWTVVITEGRNRQIRRTFERLNYKVLNLHRISIGNYRLDGLAIGKYKSVTLNNQPH
jgi:23S rRNA pseudouridine2605 synthase